MFLQKTSFCIKRSVGLQNRHAKILGIMEPDLQNFKLLAQPCWITGSSRDRFPKSGLVDLENPQKIVFYNLDGKSFTTSLQTQLDSLSVTENLDFRVSVTSIMSVHKQISASGRKRNSLSWRKQRVFQSRVHSTKRKEPMLFVNTLANRSNTWENRRF